MSLGYWPRLGLQLLSVLWLVRTAVGAIVAGLGPAALRGAERLRPRAAAGLLFGLRMAPSSLAAAVAMGLAAPSYLWLETDRGVERIGWFPLAAGAAVLAGCACSVGRGLWAVRASRRYLAGCRRLAGFEGGIWVVDGRAGVAALAGVLRPRVVLSRELAETLPAEQRDAVLRHERAHGAAGDNLKRLCLRLAPGMFWFRRRFEALDRGWSRQAEWAADDRAAGGDQQRALALAEAIVRVARAGGEPPGLVLATPLVDGTAGIAERVERLLDDAPRDAGPGRFEKTAAAAGAAAAAGLAAAASYPASMAAVHGFLERLAR